MKRDAGFTLIEVMVAVAIVGVIGVTVLSAFTATMKAGAGVSDRAELAQTARFIVKKLTEDIHAATLLHHNANGRFVGVDTADGERQADRIGFTTFNRRILFAGRGGDQAVVEWYVERPAEREGRYILRRSENPYVTDPVGTARFAEDWEVTDGLLSFNVRYLDKGRLVDAYSSELTSLLPAAVEITFELEDKAGRRFAESAFILVGGNV
jgi:prepilin-type N-terminal cleavage/methylation domain-containing protein